MTVERIDNEFMNYLLAETMRRKGTDLHLCVGTKPLVRINSELVEIEQAERIMPDKINQFVESYLSAEELKLLNKQKTLDISYSKRNLGRFRCNIYFQRGTYALAIRALPLEVPAFDSLGLPPIVETFIDKPKGLVLITGATGSGKSTTLASLVDMINQRYRYHVITIEDPLEYLHPHKLSMVTQREVGADAIDFASALKASLREDPDVIMLGEMRDMETISTALTAAETGHLVLTTLHTGSAVKSIDRILDAFNKEQHNQIRSQLATVLEGVVSQQLLPRADKSGLMAVAEVMLPTPAVRNMIREGKHYQIDNLIQTGKRQGMISLERALAERVKEGLIKSEIAYLRAADQQLFETYLKQQ